MDNGGSGVSRRGFLKSSVLGLGAAACAGPLVLQGSAASTRANSKLNLAVVGCGGQGRGVMGGILGTGDVNLVALCDPDAQQIERARQAAGGQGGAAEAYEDYRRLLDRADTFDAVLIATPDHWHAPLCKAFLAAGKHIYCEKPLTHTVFEARELRQLSKRSKVITQMGNQGSASDSLRRSTELIKAGVLGQIRDVYMWDIGVYAREGSAEGEDPVPGGFNWDLWVGPSAMRPYKAKVYHPFTWRDWYDFGNGGLADICCHAMNLPVRALDLGYPDRIVVNLQEDGRQVPDKSAVEFHFAARGRLEPVVLHWMGSARPPVEATKPLSDLFADQVSPGIIVLGEKGCIHTSHWNTDGLIRLFDEPATERVVTHAGTQHIAKTLPRVGGHDREWVDACLGKGRTFSDFDTGGHLTEIGLAGVVALRARKNLEWDGEHMRAQNAPEASRFVRPRYRKKWLV